MIVDEAQDLTPMQLRMVARRAHDGSLTILGDVAQATGAVTYRSWDEVLPHLPHGDEAAVEELRHAYRVPREIMERRAAAARRRSRRTSRRRSPTAPAPRRRRSGGSSEEHLLAEAYREAARLAQADGLLAVIVPDELVGRRPPATSGTACRC